MTTAKTTAKKTDPWIPVGHPDYVWTSGADVQRTWRKYGWVPLSEQRSTAPANEQPVMEGNEK